MATMTLIRGVTYTLTGGYPVGGLPKAFFVYGAGQVGFVPLPVIYMFVILAVGAFVLSSTPFGRSIYAIGGNEDAARLSGINVMRVKIGVFIVSAFVSAISGLILSSRLMAGSPEIGIGWELDVIAAVIIGGTNIFGGEGNLARHFPRRSVHRGAYQRNDSLGCHSLHAAGCARPGDPKRRHPQQSSRQAIGACHGPSRALYQDHRAEACRSPGDLDRRAGQRGDSRFAEALRRRRRSTTSRGKSTTTSITSISPINPRPATMSLRPSNSPNTRRAPATTRNGL